MSLASEVVEAFFGSRSAPDVLQVGLLRGSEEVRDAGYVRASVIKGRWAIDGPKAEVRVKFGPFDGPVTFDAVGVFAGTELVETVPLSGRVALLAGMTHEQVLTVAVNVGG